MVSEHYRDERNYREDFIEKNLGNGYIIDGFIVDRGHVGGAEVHSITDNGVIIIENYHTGRLITKLIARPQQLMRYYRNANREPPPEYEKALELARLHTTLGYNYI